jgi:hypothetical protein
MYPWRSRLSVASWITCHDGVRDGSTETEQVQLTGAGRYVIRDRRPDGELVIAPDTSWEAISERAGGRELTGEEWDEFMREHGSEMLPADGEGVCHAAPGAPPGGAV